MKRPTPTIKFLLVDDKEENLTALEALLRRDGLELLKARTGDEALELLLDHDVALALIDVQMPEMDGFALAELMRGAQRSRRIPIIFVTAAPQEAHREFRGYDAGAVDFLFKPIDPRILRHKVDVFYELARQRTQLEETLHLAETFMAIVGHDLKNPLNAMMLGTELILSNPSAPTVAKTAERLKNSNRRMQRMIDDLFDLARARLGTGIPIVRAPADMHKIVERVIGEIETAHPERKITCKLTHDATGEWDADRLAQVVSNLAGNAIRHGAEGVPIEVVLESDPAHVVLTVSNGGAIPPDVVPVIFDPFRSSDTRRARAEGLGLGLFIVNQIVLAHGGTVGVESDGRTTFRVTLPRHAPPDSQNGVGSQKP
jgi:signal transduction histidine kinase